MPETPAVLPAALAVTACPLLAAHLTQLHPGLRTALLTRIAGIGTLPDHDGLLLLTRPGSAAGGTTSPRTTTLYLGTDLDDAGVYERARALHADKVFVLPDQDRELAVELRQHLRTTA